MGVRVQYVSWAEVWSQDPLNAPNADSGHLAAFLSWCYSGYADANLQAKAKRVVLLGRLREAVKAGVAPRPLMSQTQG